MTDWTGVAETGGRPTTRASAGYEDRAGELQTLVRDAHQHLSGVLGTSFDPVVVVADRHDWLRAGEDAPPYGIPYASGDGPHVLVVPADHRGNFLVDGYATVAPRAVAERFADLIAVHELGHLHARAAGFELPNGWLGEFLATYLSYCFLASRRIEDARTWHSVARAHAEAVTPGHHSLEALDELYLGVGPEDYIWYQDTLTLMVVRVHDSLGAEFVLRLREAGLGPDSDGATVLDAVEAIHPGFREWAVSLRA